VNKLVVFFLLLSTISFAFIIDLPVENLNYKIEDLQGFQRINLEDGGVFDKPGAPEIPGFVFTFSLPVSNRIKEFRIINSEWEGIPGEFYLYPVQNMNIIGEPVTFVGPDSVIYNNDCYYPQSIIASFHSGNLRGYNIGQVLVFPFRYNPVIKRLEVLKRLRLEVKTGSSPSGIKPVRQTSISKSIFEKFVSKIVNAPGKGGSIFTPQSLIEENYDDLAPSELPSIWGPPVDLLIITNEQTLSAYENFARFKKLLGFNTTIRTMSWIRQNYTGFDDAERLRNFIRDAVEKWGVGFVILGNDVPEIPTRWVYVDYVMGNYPAHITTDLYFSDLDGNWNLDGDDRFGEVLDSIDLYPDVIVGRIPAHNPEDVLGYLNKIHSYIFEDVSPPNSLKPYYTKALFVSSMFWSQNDSYYIARNLLSPLLPVNFQRNFINEEPKQNFLNAVGDGYNLITFLAHGDVNLIRARTNPREFVSNFDIDSLRNNIYPFLVVITCYTGPFQEDCLGEHWVMNPCGGGIGYFGPSSSSAAYNHVDYIRSLFYTLFSSSLGSSTAQAKIPWIPYAQYDNWHRVFQYSLNLLGDPSLSMWKIKPHSIDSVIPDKDSINLGLDTLILNIYPQLDQFIVIFHKENELFVRDTGFSGVSITTIKAKSPGFLKYTVIHENFRPYIDSIYVKPGTPYPVYQHSRIVDSTGNNNGIPNPGEIVELYLGLINNGSQSADSVYLKITSPDTFINLLVDTASYNPIPPGMIGENRTPLKLGINRQTPDGHWFDLFIEIHCAGTIYDTCQFMVESPELCLFTQNYIQNGSLYKILPFIENQGHCSADSVYALISSYSDTVTVLDSIVYFNPVPPDGINPGLDTIRVLLNYPGNVAYRFSLYYHNIKVQEKRIILRLPQRIDSLWAFGNPNSITLNWIAVPGVLGYRIYRSTNPNGNFEFIKNPLRPIAYFEDYDVHQNVDYYYYICLVDSSMNQGLPSDTIRARTNPLVLQGWPRRVYGYLFSSPNFGDLDPDYPGLEITVCDRSGNLYLWHYDGTPAGSNPEGIIFQCSGEIWSSPAVGDVDNDGLLEICFGVRREGNNLYVLRRDGPNWVPLNGWPKSLPGGILGSPVLGDIDNDNDLEIFVITESGRLYAFHHDGTGVYSPDGLLKALYGWHAGSPAVGDINNDGNLEIVACGGSNSDSLFVWDHNGNYLQPFPISVAPKMHFSPVLGNVWGDADLEICFYTDSTDLVNLVDAGGHIIWQKYIPSLGDVEAYPVIANIVGNERPEVIVGNNQGSIFLSALDSLGNLILGFPTSIGYDFKLPIVADIDGDSSMDIVCGSADWNLYAFNNKAQLISGYPIHFGIRIEQSPAVYDIDEDGKLELMVGANDYKFWVFELDSRFYDWPKFRYDPYNSGWYKSHYWAGVKENIPRKNQSGLYFGISPNPFRNHLMIKFQIPEQRVGSSQYPVVSIKIYDVSGRIVKQFNHLTNYQSSVIWFGDDDSGRRLPSGVYFVHLESNGFKKTEKAILLR